MSEVKTSRPGRLLAVWAAFILLFSVALFLLAPRIDGRPRDVGPEGQAGAEEAISSADGTTVYGVPNASVVAMDALASPPAASIAVEVLDPAAVREALFTNPWLREVLTKPLGRGFLGTWAAFLGSRGEDLRARFSGLVLDVIAEQVLDRPFAVVWFAGRGVTGVPAMIVPEPSAAARAAFNALDAVASRGAYSVSRCLARDDHHLESEPADRRGERGGAEAHQRDEAAGARDVSDITIKRWLLADHAVYAALAGDRLVLARRPTTVLQGICVELAALAPKQGVALEVALASEALGRDAQLITLLLGLSTTPRLSFGIEKGTLVPRGISAAVVTGGRLAGGKLSKQMLRVIPEEAPVVLALQLLLPKELTAESLEAYLTGKGGETAARQAAIIWYPSGRRDGDTHLGLVWSSSADREALASMFGNGLKLLAGAPCDHLLLVSSDEIGDRLTRSCKGGLPSLLHASQSVAAGWQKPLSIGLGVHLGQALSRLTLEAFEQEQGGKELPPEMLEVKGQLEALPFIGVSGLVEGAVLAPGGFRS